MKRRLYYGWLHSDGTFRVSRQPPDAPVRASTEFDSKEDVDAFAARHRADILWWPPLPQHRAAAVRRA